MIIYLNGNFLDANQATISIWDGGFLYGDGIFTTLRLYSGIPIDLDAHYLRLTEQSAALSLPVPFSLAELASIIDQLAQSNNMTQADTRVRITISRGGSWEDPLPLSNLATITPTALITMAALSTDHARWKTEGITATCLGPKFARGNTPALKTLNALPSILALRAAAAAGFQDALIADSDGLLLEGAVSNIFLVIDGKLKTPSLDCGLLAGRTRARLLSLAAGAGLTTEEKALPKELLNSADEVFLAGSVREVLPVIDIDGKHIGDGRPGPVTLLMQALYDQTIAQEIVRSRNRS